MASILAKKVQQAEQDMMNLLAEVNQIQDPQPVPGEPDQKELEHLYSKTLDKQHDDNASSQDEQESNLETREKQVELNDKMEIMFENEESKKELDVEELNPDSNYPDIIHLNEVELTIDAAALDNQTVDNIHSNENGITSDDQTADIIHSNENDITSDDQTADIIHSNENELTLDQGSADNQTEDNIHSNENYITSDDQTAGIIHSNENDITSDDQTADIIHTNENEPTLDQASADNQTMCIINNSNENEPIINEACKDNQTADNIHSNENEDTIDEIKLESQTRNSENILDTGESIDSHKDCINEKDIECDHNETNCKLKDTVSMKEPIDKEPNPAPNGANVFQNNESLQTVEGEEAIPENQNKKEHNIETESDISELDIQDINNDQNDIETTAEISTDLGTHQQSSSQCMGTDTSDLVTSIVQKPSILRKVSFGPGFAKYDDESEDSESDEDGDGSVGRLDDAEEELEEIERNPDKKDRSVQYLILNSTD